MSIMYTIALALGIIGVLAISFCIVRIFRKMHQLASDLALLTADRDNMRLKLQGRDRACNSYKGCLALSHKESEFHIFLNSFPLQCARAFRNRDSDHLSFLQIVMQELASSSYADFIKMIYVPENANTSVFSSYDESLLQEFASRDLFGEDSLVRSYYARSGTLSILESQYSSDSNGFISQPLAFLNPHTNDEVKYGNLVIASYLPLVSRKTMIEFLHNLVIEFGSVCCHVALRDLGKDSNTKLLSKDYYKSNRCKLFTDFLAERRCRHMFFKLDIDDFSKFNDEYSHAVGDFVLRSFGAIVRDTIRPNEDVLFHRGGDEIGGLVPLKGGVEDAEAFFTRIRSEYARRMPELIQEEIVLQQTLAEVDGIESSFRLTPDCVPGITVGFAVVELCCDPASEFHFLFADSGPEFKITPCQIDRIEALVDLYEMLGKSLGKARTCSPHNPHDEALVPVFQQAQEFVHTLDDDRFDTTKVLRHSMVVEAFRKYHGSSFDVAEAVRDVCDTILLAADRRVLVV